MASPATKRHAARHGGDPASCVAATTGTSGRHGLGTFGSAEGGIGGWDGRVLKFNPSRIQSWSVIFSLQKHDSSGSL